MAEQYRTLAETTLALIFKSLVKKLYTITILTAIFSAAMKRKQARVSVLIKGLSRFNC